MIFIRMIYLLIIILVHGENFTFLNHVLCTYKYCAHFTDKYLFYLYRTKYSIMGQLIKVCTIILVKQSSVVNYTRKET